MSTWAIRTDWRFEAVEVVKETANMVFYIDRSWRDGHETRQAKDSFLDWRGDEDTAHALVAKLTSAGAEYERRGGAALDWYKKRKADILASAGEARSDAATEIGAAEGEHATAESRDAHNQVRD